MDTHHVAHLGGVFAHADRSVSLIFLWEAIFLLQIVNMFVAFNILLYSHSILRTQKKL